MSASLRIGQTFTDWRDIPKDAPPCVYCLVDPRAPFRPRYLGATKNLRNRMQQHWAPSHQHDAELWKGTLRADGVKCAVRVVEVFATANDAFRAEWRIAARWRRRRIALLGKHDRPSNDQADLTPSAWSSEPYPVTTTYYTRAS